MYVVKLFEDFEDKEGLTIHSPFALGAKLNSAKLKTKLKGIDEFSFSLNLKNPGFGKVKPLVSLVAIILEKTGKIVFSGRVLKPTHSMSSDGSFTQEYICESILAYLYDSTQRYLEMKNTNIEAYFTKVIENHNKFVESHKRFKVGRINAKNTTGTKHRWIGYDKTYDTIRDLLDKEGGYLVLREEESGTYLDYVDVPGVVSNTKIEIKKNLKSVTREIDTTNIVTRVVPLGEALETSDSEVSKRLTITNINGGLDYLDNIPLQREFGIIEESVIWDEAAGSSDLLEKGKAYVKNQTSVATEVWNVSALDLSIAGYKLEGFEVGNSYIIVNPLISVEEPLLVLEKDLDLLNPSSSSLVFGEKQKTLSQYQVDSKKMKAELSQVKGSVMSQQAKVTRLNDDILSVSESLSAVQKDLENANLTDIANRLQLIQDSLQNIEVNYATATSLEIVRNALLAETSKQTLINAQIEARLLALEGGTIK
ncbi:TPA_asm: hypothetical protein GYP86_00435 [Listeria monocytogenes]|nr:hypothetical protein [Listeria monocytogenes]HAB7874277.1 hypothetical protein [Listeria monocytogenes]HAB7883860.1 hypothetical protein [Listeria monocytogenes]HAC0409859.1 hypothetical protein [Listeria monocytogenes]